MNAREQARKDPHGVNLAVGMGAIALYFMIQLIAQTALIGLLVLSTGANAVSSPSFLRDLSRNGALNGSTIILTGLLTLPLLYVAIIKIQRRPFHEATGLVNPPRIPMWSGASIALATAVTLDGVTLLLQKPLVPEVLRDLYAPQMPGLVILIVAVVFVAPPLEELIFRGLFYTAAAEALGTTSAVVLTSTLFGVVHVCTYGQDWYSVGQTLVMGTVLTILRAWAHSLWPSIVAHTTNNLYSTIEILLLLYAR